MKGYVVAAMRQTPWSRPGSGCEGTAEAWPGGRHALLPALWGANSKTTASGTWCERLTEVRGGASHNLNITQ